MIIDIRVRDLSRESESHGTEVPAVRPSPLWRSASYSERTLTTSVEEPSSAPRYPGYAELDLENLPELSGRSRVDVVVETPREGLFWALVSITNNVTQQVTTVTP